MLVNLQHNNETPAPGTRGDFKNDLLSSAVETAYTRTALSDQLVAHERLVAKQIACFSASCAMQACLVWEGDRTDAWGMVMAERVADDIGLTRAVGVGDLRALLHKKFSAALEFARVGRINVSKSRNAFDRRLLAVFDAYLTLTVSRVRAGEITRARATIELDDFLNSNGRLYVKFGTAHVRRMAIIALLNVQEEAA